MRKRRTREHVIADLSVHHVEGFVLRCGWTVERKRHDYGLDLYMQTYNGDGETENGWVWFQLKATDSLRPGRYQMSRSGLAYACLPSGCRPGFPARSSRPRGMVTATGPPRQRAPTLGRRERRQ
jgi:Domain of unknown function (DUF4365)